MAIALGIILLAAGLILVTNAVHLPASWETHISHDTLGWILVAVGGLSVLAGLLAAYWRGRAARTTATTVEEPRYDDGAATTTRRDVA